jgi:hypothetical protein
MSCYASCSAHSSAVSAFSRFIPPCQPTLRPAPPRGPGWSHEVKFDGWRLQLHKAGRRVRLLSRHGHDITSGFPTIASALAGIKANTAILDGELVATSSNGLPDFRSLHRRSAEAPLAVWIFDLLEVNGKTIDRHPSPSGAITSSTSSHLCPMPARFAIPKAFPIRHASSQRPMTSASKASCPSASTHHIGPAGAPNG